MSTSKQEMLTNIFIEANYKVYADLLKLLLSWNQVLKLKEIVKKNHFQSKFNFQLNKTKNV